MPIKSFRDLKVYTMAYEASLEVHRKICENLPMSEKYDLRDQLSRSSKAVPRLIAEGYAKRHQKLGFQKYVDDALAESNETIVSLEHSRDLYPKSINQELVTKLVDAYDQISKMLYTLRKVWKNF